MLSEAGMRKWRASEFKARHLASGISFVRPGIAVREGTDVMVDDFTNSFRSEHDNTLRSS